VGVTSCPKGRRVGLALGSQHLVNSFSESEVSPRIESSHPLIPVGAA